MNKKLQYLSNASFFGGLLLIYFHYVELAIVFTAAMNVLVALLHKEPIESIVKFTFQNFWSFLLFSGLGVFQYSIIPVGIISFLAPLITLYFKQQNKLVVGGLLIGILVVEGVFTPNFLSKFQTHTELNEASPEFHLVEFKSRTAISSNDLKGKVVIVNFWATWCGTCVKEMQPLNKSYLKYKDHPEVQFLAVNTPKWSSDELNAIARFIENKNLDLPVYLDTDGSMSEDFDILSIPTLYIIDKEGNLKARHVGFPAGENLEQYIDEEIEKLL